MLLTVLPLGGVFAAGNGISTRFDSKGTLTIEGNGKIDDYKFYDNDRMDDIEKVIIKDGVTAIGEGAFTFCGNIKSVIIGNGVKTIGEGAFDMCEALESVTIGKSVTDIGNNAFSSCYNLKSITIPDSVTRIGDFAFSECDELKSATIGNGVKTIGKYAFYMCGSLANVKLGNSVATIGGYAFNGTSIKSITIPDSVTSIEDNAFFDTALESIKVGSKNKHYTSVDGVLFNKNKTELILYPCMKKDSSYIVPNTVTSIHANAFFDCQNLERVTVFKNVKSIGKDALGYYTSAGGHDFAIIGVKGSAAEKYAKENKIVFIVVSAHHVHTYKSTVVKTATTERKGELEKRCSCGSVESKSAIAKITSIKLSKKKFTYNGKAQKPTVTVKDSKGKTLKNGTDYTVKYSKGRKDVGEYTVKITFKGKYSGTKTLTFKIVPKGTSISKLKAGKKQFTAKWSAQTTQTTGYELQYSTKSSMSGAKKVTVKKNKTTSSTVKKLKGGKKYYVRVRTYKTVKVNGKSVKLYSSWSKVKNVKTK